jgi:hypothetical protein
MLYRRMESIFEEYNVTAWLEIIDLAIMNRENLSGTEMAGLIFEQLSMIADDLFQVQGVNLNSEAEIPLSVKAEMLEGMNTITTYEDKLTMMRLMESDSSAEEKYAEALSLVCAVDIGTMLSYVKNVEDHFPTIIINALAYVEEQEALKSFTPIIGRMKDFISRVLSLEDHPLLKYLDQNTTIGLEFSQYVEMEKVNGLFSGDLLEDTPAREAAVSLVLLACLSKDGFQNPQVTVQDYIFKEFKDTQIATKLCVFMNEVLAQLNRG